MIQTHKRYYICLVFHYVAGVQKLLLRSHHFDIAATQTLFTASETLSSLSHLY